MPGRLEQVIEWAGDRLGVAVLPQDRLQLLENRAYQLELFREEASELGYHEMGYFSGRPQELLPEARKKLAQQSRVALMVDPLAGAEAQLRTNFALGNGVGKAQAPEPKVQEVIDELWSDPVNQEKLFKFEAQRHRSFQLISDANLFLTAYVRGGRVRIGFLDPDLVTTVVADPDDDERPLYYLAHARRQVWDVKEDRLKSVDELDEDGKPRLVYWPHWRNVEDYRREVKEARKAGEDVTEIEDPSKYGKLGPGVIYHVRINRIGRTEFGSPPFARTLRFYSAMNQLVEASVQMQMAASSIVAKNVVRGTPEQTARQASAILNQGGELASSRFGVGDAPMEFRDRAAGAAGPGAASLWYENESSRLEAVNLSSGSGQAMQTAAIARAPISAASGFGQHYLGDASNANLATATTLELPTLMEVGAWQETIEDMLRWLTDYQISVAARAGRLGGQTAALPSADEQTPSSGKPLSELWVMESFDLAELEKRTGLNLAYTFEMPYPGRRNLPDVTTFASTMATTFDMEGMNVGLRRSLLEWVATHGMQLADPSGWVDEVLPEDSYDQKILDAIFQRQLDAHTAATGATPDGKTPPAAPQPQIALKPKGGRGKKPADEKSVRGEKRRGKPPGREMGSMTAGAEEDVALRWLAEVVGDDFTVDVLDPVLAAARNGNEHGGT